MATPATTKRRRMFLTASCNDFWTKAKPVHDMNENMKSSGSWAMGGLSCPMLPERDYEACRLTCGDGCRGQVGAILASWPELELNLDLPPRISAACMPLSVCNGLRLCMGAALWQRTQTTQPSNWSSAMKVSTLKILSPL